MHRLTAHELLAAAAFETTDGLASWLPEDCEPIWQDCVDPTVALIAAGAELSGLLPDCRTLEDIREAFDHFVSLLVADVVTGSDWNAATQCVICDVLSWGDAFRRKLEMN